MTLALHQNPSARAGYKGSLEGWAKAGISQVELAWNQIAAFVKTDSVAAARMRLDPRSMERLVAVLSERPTTRRCQSASRLGSSGVAWGMVGIVVAACSAASPRAVPIPTA